MIGAAVIGCAFLTACAADIDNRPLTEALLIVGGKCFVHVQDVNYLTLTVVKLMPWALSSPFPLLRQHSHCVHKKRSGKVE